MTPRDQPWLDGESLDAPAIERGPIKQTHIERMVSWFRIRGHKATLGEILKSGESWSYEFRARMTDARKRGIEFVCQQDHHSPSNNVYRLVEQKGQMDLI